MGGLPLLLRLNLSNAQITHDLDLHPNDVHTMTRELCQEVVQKRPEVTPSGTVEGYEVDFVDFTVGHKGHSAEAVHKKVARVVVTSSKGYPSRSKL